MSHNILLGTAIGDSLGLPFEGLKADHEDLKKWDSKTFLPSRPRKPTYYGANVQLDAGQYTDDTIFSLCVAESLIENKGFNPDDLSKRYMDAVFTSIGRGYGRTTYAAMEALKNGTHWSKTGIEGSFGNGTAMRASPFGIYFRNDLKALIDAVKIDSAITHRSNEAEAGALAIALATYFIANNDEKDLIKKITKHLPKSVVKKKLSLFPMLLPNVWSPKTILKYLGTSADVRETVPASLYCYLKFQDYRSGVVAAIKAGGDSDTTGAIVGAMFGAKFGIKGIPSEWVNKIENGDKLIILDCQLFSKNNSKFLK